MQNLIEGQSNYFFVDLDNMENYTGQDLKVKLDKKGCDTHYVSITNRVECDTYLELTLDLNFCIDKTGLWVLTITDEAKQTIYQTEVTIYKNKEK